MTRTLTLLAAALPLLSATPVGAAPNFPLEAIGSECYILPGGSGMCTASMRFTFKGNGTVDSDAGDGTWAFFSDTFIMTLLADLDGDGQPDNRKDYIGHLAQGCVVGDVRDRSIPVIGEFEICPR